MGTAGSLCGKRVSDAGESSDGWIMRTTMLFMFWFFRKAGTYRQYVL